MQVFSSESMTINKVGVAGGDAYLITTPEKTMLYDSGFAHAAPSLVREVDELLEGRLLDYLFLSHSHYDHASGSVWVKECWPQCVILGSAYTAHVFTRPGARKTMSLLNVEALKGAQAAGLGTPKTEDPVAFPELENLTVDEIVGEGSIIDLGSIQLEVIEAPGHTRCSLMLWCPKESLLFGSESLGIMLSSNMVGPICLSSYQDCLDSISKAQALKPQHILVSHQYVLDGEEATRYLINAQLWAQKTAHLVWESHARGKTKDEIALTLKELFYGEHLKAHQPEAAFDLNNGIVIDQLLASKELNPL